MAHNDELDGLADGLASTTEIIAAFTGELEQLQATAERTKTGVSSLERSMSGGLRKAFDGVVFDGYKLSDALGVVGKSIANTAYNAALKPVTDHFGGMVANGINGLFGGAFAKGAVMSGGNVQAFAKGGVIDGPATFPMKGGIGLMGEAGPEAIMPLTRGTDGKLGVKSQGGAAQSVHVTMNISTPDVQGFQRSQSQVAAQMSRALSRGQRNS